jgi:hypothetical protein
VNSRNAETPIVVPNTAPAGTGVDGRFPS